MGIYIEARDILGDDDWRQLRREAMDELLGERGYRHPCVVTDILDARSAMEGNRKAEALFLLDRAIDEIKTYAGVK